MHGDPADHDADGRASRGQRDPIIGQEGVEGAKLAGALCGWGVGLVWLRSRRSRENKKEDRIVPILFLIHHIHPSKNNRNAQTSSER